MAAVTPDNSSTNTSPKKANFENTAYSTKNNGLIFLPTTTVTTSPQLNYEKIETYDENLMKISSPQEHRPKQLGVQLTITDFSKPVASAKPEAFDNAVYNYVDNLRLHSKRLSEINLLSQSQAAAALAVAQINVTINASQQQINQQNSHQLSRSGSTSSSPSSSSVLSSSPSQFMGSVNSQSLAKAASAVEEKLGGVRVTEKSEFTSCSRKQSINEIPVSNLRGNLFFKTLFFSLSSIQFLNLIE